MPPRGRRRNTDIDTPLAAISGQALTSTVNPYVVIRQHHHIQQFTKEKYLIRNWNKDKVPPYLCFVELFVLLLFFLLAFAIQKQTIPFFQDFGTAIDNYFLGGYDIDEDDVEDSSADRRIYSKTDFLSVFNSTLYRFFAFNTTFPCSYELTPDSFLILEINDVNDIQFIYYFDKNNKTEADDIIELYLDNFSIITLSMSFLVDDTQNNNTFDAKVITIFENYLQTGIILWQNTHERTTKRKISNPSVFLRYLANSVSILILLLLLIGIFLETQQIVFFVQHMKEKALTNRTKLSLILKRKIKTRLWDICTLICNIFSFLCVLIYLFNANSINDSCPWPNFLLAIGSFIHSYLIIRFLKMRPQNLLVIRTILGGIVCVLQYIVGCIPFFFGFMIAGVGMFGWTSPIMTSSRESAKVLIATSYGDYLLDGYDDLGRDVDKARILPSIYLTLWIFNGMGIWFYVVLAILNEVLFKEIKIAKYNIEEDSEHPDEDFNPMDPLPWLLSTD